MATPLSGDVSNLAFFVNAVYDMPVSSWFALSLGFGLGADQFDPAITAAGFRISDSETAFAWHVLAGLTMPIGRQFELGLDYRYQEIDGTNHEFFATEATPISIGAKNSQAVMLNLRWFVGG